MELLVGEENEPGSRSGKEANASARPDGSFLRDVDGADELRPTTSRPGTVASTTAFVLGLPRNFLASLTPKKSLRFTKYQEPSS